MYTEPKPVVHVIINGTRSEPIEGGMAGARAFIARHRAAVWGSDAPAGSNHPDFGTAYEIVPASVQPCRYGVAYAA